MHKATYPEIKDYVIQKYVVQASNLNIAQAKAKVGISEKESYNWGAGRHKQTGLTKEKAGYIEDAFLNFGMLKVR